jgi:hypothetical protein
MRASNLALSLSLCLLPLAAAHAGPSSWFGSQVDGDGHLKTEERRLPAFQKVQLRTSLDVVITEGPTAQTRVTVDGNLQPLLTTTVEGDTLIIDTKDRGIDESRGSKVELVMPRLAGVAIHGSGDVRVERSSAADTLELAIHGSGDLKFRGSARSVTARIHGSGDMSLGGGKAERLAVEIRGSGNVSAKELPARDATVSINGSGDTELTATGGELAFEIRGSGDVTWHGEGQVKRTEIRGSGEVSRR